MPSSGTRRIVILVFEDAQLFDISGPASVFIEAAACTRSPPYRIVLVSATGGPISTGGGIAVSTLPIAGYRGPAALLLVPGGTPAALRRVMGDGALRKRAMSIAARAQRVASVCTGAFVLADWGFLDGRRAATHWQAADALATHFPAVEVDAESLYVEDGRVWTSAGVSTGIDMALAMVEKDLGADIASQVAKRLVLQMRRAGHQSQFSPLLDAQQGAYAGLAAWVGEHLSSALSVQALAERAGESLRTFHRRFTAETGTTPAAFVARLRLDRARALLESGLPGKQVARDTGFGSLDRLGRAFRRAYALSPSAYRTLHARSKPA